VWHSNSKYRKVIWQCNHKYGGDKVCSTPHFSEDELEQLFISAANKVLPDREGIIADFEGQKDILFDTSELQSQLFTLQDELNVVAGLVEQCVKENAHVAQDQNEYRKRYESLVERFNQAKRQIDEISDKIADKNIRKGKLENFLKTLASMPDIITTFDALQFRLTVKYITIYSKDDVRFTFWNGTEIKA